MNTKILIVDDEPKIGKLLKRTLEREGWEAHAFERPDEAVEHFKKSPSDIVLCDLKMPEMSGIEMLEKVKQISPQTEFIMITAYASAESAVDSMKKGAYDYLIKPFAMDEVKMLIKRILETRSLREENVRLHQMVDEKFRMENIIALSKPMQDVMNNIRKVAPTDSTVLLRGESGTGKEVLATAIHQNSGRRDRPFLKINCGALPETLLESELFGHVRGAFTGAEEHRTGLFETCDGGSIFLDEIGEVSPALQVKLLRVLQDGEFQAVGDSKTRKADVRIIAATNRDLEEMMHQGLFRKDLYYRLNVVPITIPPLRERRDDIPVLIDHFIQRFKSRTNGRTKDIEPQAFRTLLAYDWPGNIRELENAIEHGMIMGEGPSIRLEDLPLALRTAHSEAQKAPPIPTEHYTLEELEKQAIINALEKERYNYTKAARHLGITRRTLGYRMQKYDIPGKYEREGSKSNGNPAET